MTNAHEVYGATSVGKSWRGPLQEGQALSEGKGPGVTWEKRRRGTAARMFEKIRTGFTNEVNPNYKLKNTKVKEQRRSANYVPQQTIPQPRQGKYETLILPKVTVEQFKLESFKNMYTWLLPPGTWE